MNQKFIQSAVLGSIMLGVIAFGNFNANATGFNKNINKNGKAISASQFYEILDKTDPSKIVLKFGTPDKIATLKDFTGDVSGVVWTYQNAVSRQDKVLNANFVLVKGEFKYVTLSSAS